MRTHLLISRQFCWERSERGPSQSCILVSLQAHAPDGISEMASGSVPASGPWHRASNAPSCYSLARNRAFRLCNSGSFTSCVCITIIYQSGSRALERSMPIFFQQVNGRAQSLSRHRELARDAPLGAPVPGLQGALLQAWRGPGLALVSYHNRK